MIDNINCPNCGSEAIESDLPSYEYDDQVCTRTDYCWCLDCRWEWDYVRYFRLFRAEIQGLHEMQDFD